MSVKLGLSAQVYRYTGTGRSTWGPADANGFATGTAHANLTAMPLVKDVTLNLEKGEADVSTRGNNGWHASLGTLKSATLDLDLVYDPADAGVTALIGGFLLNSNIALAVLDGDKAAVGTEGLWADFQVMKIDKSEPLENAQMVKVTLKPALTSIAPEYVKVTA